VATLEQVAERDQPVETGDLDHAVELDHRQPPTGRGDRVALTGVRLLADQKRVAGRLPGGELDDGRLAGEIAARVVGRGRHDVLRCWAPAPAGYLGRLSIETAHATETHRSRVPSCLPRPSGART